MKPIAISLILMCLGGCGGPRYMWVHSDHADKTRFDRDVAQCEYEAAQGTASYSQGATARTTGGAISQGISEGIAISNRRMELGVLCMKARGYSQRPVDGTVIR